MINDHKVLRETFQRPEVGARPQIDMMMQLHRNKIRGKVQCLLKLTSKYPRHGYNSLNLNRLCTASGNTGRKLEATPSVYSERAKGVRVW